eukprot:scaffold86469_cov51-Phaeocystis_antarctica.AAC.3
MADVDAPSARRLPSALPPRGAHHAHGHTPRRVAALPTRRGAHLFHHEQGRARPRRQSGPRGAAPPPVGWQLQQLHRRAQAPRRRRLGRRGRRGGRGGGQGAEFVAPSQTRQAAQPPIYQKVVVTIRLLSPSSLSSYILGDSFPRLSRGRRLADGHHGSAAGRHDAALPLDGGLVRCERARHTAPGEEGFRCVLAAGHSEDPPRRRRQLPQPGHAGDDRHRRVRLGAARSQGAVSAVRGGRQVPGRVAAARAAGEEHLHGRAGERDAGGRGGEAAGGGGRDARLRLQRGAHHGGARAAAAPRRPPPAGA